MTREGAESVMEAMIEIYLQCEATTSCENCPLYEANLDCCGNLFKHIPGY